MGERWLNCNACFWYFLVNLTISFQTHLQKYFSPFVTGALVSEFRKHCSKTDEKESVSNRILIEIISVTHGNPQLTVEFVLHALQEKTTKIPFANLKLVSGMEVERY